MASLRKGGRRGRGLEVDLRGSPMKISFVESDLPQSKTRFLGDERVTLERPSPNPGDRVQRRTSSCKEGAPRDKLTIPGPRKVCAAHLDPFA